MGVIFLFVGLFLIIFGLWIVITGHAPGGTRAFVAT
jgi:hypothetical protein